MMQIDMQTVYNVLLVVINIIMAYLAARWGLKTPTPQPAPTPAPPQPVTPTVPPVVPTPDSPLNKLPFDGLFLKLLLEVLAGRKILVDVPDEEGGIQSFTVMTEKKD